MQAARRRTGLAALLLALPACAAACTCQYQLSVCNEVAAGALVFAGKVQSVSPRFLDPWGRPYLYRRPGQAGSEYDLLTFGRDGVPGGSGEDADIIVGH